jgi:2-oxoisovalerate ferredoxin oxidoreductase beta subunit
MASYTVSHQRPACFYPEYERKGELTHHTHYCPGCGHGIVTKLLALAIDELGIQDRTILVNPVGCSVFGYYYFDVGNLQVSHGRAPAVATGAKRSRPDAIVLSYQGDGDLAAIGSAEMLHTANRGEPITMVFVNNGIYGMTGGQMAPTTPLGRKTTTSPFGRDAINEGYPLKVCELLATLDAPVFIERVALGDNKQIMHAAKSLKKALENQVKGLGFSLIEVLSPCPTIWKMDPVAAQKYVDEQMTKVFPPGVYRDRTKEVSPRPAPHAAPEVGDIPRILGIGEKSAAPGGDASRQQKAKDARIRIAGFGGQGVLMLGQVMAEAGLACGMDVSWLPSYGPEMRSGTSNCHVRLSSKTIDSPLVTKPQILIALNQPSLEKFIASVEPGGWVFYNDDHLPEGLTRSDVNVVAINFTKLADGCGDPRAGNIVALGAVLETTGILPSDAVDNALAKIVKTARWLELDRRALQVGRTSRSAVYGLPRDLQVDQVPILGVDG